MPLYGQRDRASRLYPVCPPHRKGMHRSRRSEIADRYRHVTININPLTDCRPSLLFREREKHGKRGRDLQVFYELFRIGFIYRSIKLRVDCLNLTFNISCKDIKLIDQLQKLYVLEFFIIHFHYFHVVIFFYVHINNIII